MQFNSNVNNFDICSDINFWASTDDVSYPLEDKARNANFALSRVSSKIMKFDRTWKHVSSNATTIPIAVTDLESGIDNYSFATSHLKILRVRITDRNGVKKTLKAKDRRTMTDDELNATGEPESYDKIGFSLMPTPVPDYGATEGLEIEYQPGAEQDFFSPTDTTKEPGFNPDFHRLISLYAARDYCAIFNRERLNIIDAEIKTMETDLEQFFESRDVDDEPKFKAKKSNRAIGLL